MIAAAMVKHFGDLVQRSGASKGRPSPKPFHILISPPPQTTRSLSSMVPGHERGNVSFFICYLDRITCVERLKGKAKAA